MSITFELTQDTDHLERYYQIREECFRKDLGLKTFNGTEDDHDRNGHILVIKAKDQCIGGVRISGADINTATLPMEKDGFKLAEHLPELSLDSITYCQWGRLALMPEYRGIATAKRICRVLLKSCTELGYRYAFNVAGLNRARLYKHLHSSLGYDYYICDHLSLPAEEGFSNLEYLLSVSSIPAHGQRTLPPLTSLFAHHKAAAPLPKSRLMRVA